MPQPPVILMAFSNDREGKFLRNISEEHQKLKAIFSPLVDKGIVQVVDLPNASLDDVFQTFKKYKDRVAVFHYGGHAHDMELLFSQQQNPVDMEYFSKYLAQQKGLQIVFFNACTTLPQLNVLQQTGISHLILTDSSINDEAAKLFSESFYQHLTSGRTVSRSFQEATAEVETKIGGSTRGLIWEGQQIVLDKSLPWKHIASSYPDWVLPTRKPFPLKAAVISLLILLLSVLAGYQIWTRYFPFDMTVSLQLPAGVDSTHFQYGHSLALSLDEEMINVPFSSTGYAIIKQVKGIERAVAMNLQSPLWVTEQTTLSLSRSPKVIPLQWAPKYSHIQGRIRDETGLLEGVQVLLEGSQTSDTTDGQGYFKLLVPEAQIPNIKHKLYVQKEGYESIDVNINLMDETDLFSIFLPSASL